MKRLMTLAAALAALMLALPSAVLAQTRLCTVQTCTVSVTGNINGYHVEGCAATTCAIMCACRPPTPQSPSKTLVQEFLASFLALFLEMKKACLNGGARKEGGPMSEI